MSEAKAPQIDPRFDPRYQRGYVPDAAAGAAPSPPEPRVPAPATVVNVEPARAAPALAEPSPADPTPPEPAPAEPEASPMPPSADPADRPAADAASDPEDEPVLTALFGPTSAEEPSGFAAWFVAGWGVSLVAAVVGVALWWAGMESENYYYGPSNESDRWLQIVGWTVAPSLVEAGLLGLVAMLVWTGILHTRHQEEPS